MSTTQLECLTRDVEVAYIEWKRYHVSLQELREEYDEYSAKWRQGKSLALFNRSSYLTVYSLLGIKTPRSKETCERKIRAVEDYLQGCQTFYMDRYQAWLKEYQSTCNR
jgi:endonuclease YncB( thermonuclease family)